VYVVSDVIDSLELSAMEAVTGDEERRHPSDAPRMMTKVLGYGYCVGVLSTRRLERGWTADVGFRVLAAGNAPNFRPIADIRKLHLARLAGRFAAELKMGLEAGVLKLGRVALDGTKMKANARKHKAMNGRRQEQERQLRAEVRELLVQAVAVDAAEDVQYGAAQRGELAAERPRRAPRLRQMGEATRALEERAREQAEKAGKPRAEVKQAQPADPDQYNFCDAKSRLLKGSDGWVQGYNAQAAVAPSLQLTWGSA
jgi:transposase